MTALRKAVLLLLLSFGSFMAAANDEQTTDSFCRRLISRVAKELKHYERVTGDRMLSNKKDMDLVLLSEFTNTLMKPKPDDPLVQDDAALMQAGGKRLRSAIEEVATLGGEIQKGSPYFHVTQEGKPILRITSREDLPHELAHFRLWKEIREALIEQEYEPAEASMLAFATLGSPMGNLHAEVGAALVDLNELKKKKLLKEEDVKEVLFRRSYPFLSALKHSICLSRCAVGQVHADVLLEALQEDSDRIVRAFLRNFDKHQDRAHAHFSQAMARFTEETVVTEFMQWARKNPNWLVADLGSMPPVARLYVMHVLTSRNERGQTIVRYSHQTDELIADEISKMILSARIPPQ